MNHLFKEHPLVSTVTVVDARRSRKISEESSVQHGYGRASNDHIDSEMLAELSRRNLAPAIHIPTAEQMEIRTINRFRFDAVIANTRAKNKIHALLTFHGASASIKVLLEKTDRYETIKQQLRRKYQSDVKKHGKMIARFNLARRIVKNIYWMLTSNSRTSVSPKALLSVARTPGDSLIF